MDNETETGNVGEARRCGDTGTFGRTDGRAASRPSKTAKDIRLHRVYTARMFRALRSALVSEVSFLKTKRRRENVREATNAFLD